MLQDVLTPDDQLLLLRRFMQEFQEKILASVQDPSHTDWIRSRAGIEPHRWMTEDLDIPLLKSGSVMNLTVNDQRYKILLFHAIARFGSSFNRTHPHKRMLEMHRDADVVIAGHRHIGAMEKTVHRDEKMPSLVQLGTFKTKDEFGERYGMVPRPQVFFPTMFFDARRHNIEMIEDIQAAQEFLAASSHYARQMGVAYLGYGSSRGKT